MVQSLMTGHIVMCLIGADALRRFRRHHSGLVAVIHDLSTVLCARGMRHRAWQFNRGGAALHGQRHDQYPYHEKSDERAHRTNLAHAKMACSHDTISQHPACQRNWPLALLALGRKP
jgi:hypothetical protein